MLAEPYFFTGAMVKNEYIALSIERVTDCVLHSRCKGLLIFSGLRILLAIDRIQRSARRAFRLVRLDLLANDHTDC